MDSDDGIEFLGTRLPKSIELHGPRGLLGHRPVSGVTLRVHPQDEEDPAGRVSMAYRRSQMSVIEIGRLSSTDAVGGFSMQDIGKALFRCAVVSRKHAKIAFSDSGFAYLIDLNSHHGTYVRKQNEIVSRRLKSETPTLLADGDVLTFGKSVGRNADLVRPVVARVELQYVASTPATTMASCITDAASAISGSVFKPLVVPNGTTHPPSPSRSNSGRYGVYIPSSSEDSDSSRSEDHELYSDIEEIPPPADSSKSQLQSQTSGLGAQSISGSGSNISRAFEVLKRLLPPTHSPSESNNTNAAAAAAAAATSTTTANSTTTSTAALPTEAPLSLPSLQSPVREGSPEYHPASPYSPGWPSHSPNWSQQVTPDPYSSCEAFDQGEFTLNHAPSSLNNAEPSFIRSHSDFDREMESFSNDMDALSKEVAAASNVEAFHEEMGGLPAVEMRNSGHDEPMDFFQLFSQKDKNPEKNQEEQEEANEANQADEVNEDEDFYVDEEPIAPDNRVPAESIGSEDRGRGRSRSKSSSPMEPETPPDIVEEPSSSPILLHPTPDGVVAALMQAIEEDPRPALADPYTLTPSPYPSSHSSGSSSSSSSYSPSDSNASSSSSSDSSSICSSRSQSRSCSRSRSRSRSHSRSRSQSIPRQDDEDKENVETPSIPAPLPQLPSLPSMSTLSPTFYPVNNLPLPNANMFSTLPPIMARTFFPGSAPGSSFHGPFHGLPPPPMATPLQPMPVASGSGNPSSSLRAVAAVMQQAGRVPSMVEQFFEDMKQRKAEKEKEKPSSEEDVSMERVQAEPSNVNTGDEQSKIGDETSKKTSQPIWEASVSIQTSQASSESSLPVTVSVPVPHEVSPAAMEGLKAEMAGLLAEVTELQAESTKLQDSTRALESQSADLVASTNLLEAQSADLVATTSDLETSANKMQATTNDLQLTTSDLKTSNADLQAEISKLNLHRQKYKARFNTNVHRTEARFSDYDERLTHLKDVYDEISIRVDNLAVDDVMFLKGRLEKIEGSLLRRDQDRETISAQDNEATNEVKALKELVNEMRTLREKTQNQMAVELDAVKAARDLALACIAKHTTQVEAEAEQRMLVASAMTSHAATPVLTSLKRKRDDTDEDGGEREQSEVGDRENESMSVVPGQDAASTLDGVDVLMEDITTASTSVHVDAAVVDSTPLLEGPSPRKRAKKFATIAAQTATALTVGAIATWTALAFS